MTQAKVLSAILVKGKKIVFSKNQWQSIFYQNKESEIDSSGAGAIRELNALYCIFFLN